MEDHERLLKAIDLLYGSILEENDLARSFRAIANLMGARGVGYLDYDLKSGVALRAETIDVDPAAQVEYQAYFSTVDIRVAPALSAPVGAIVTEYSLIDDRTFKASEIYDFSIRYDVPHIMAVHVARSPRSISTFSLQGSYKRGRFLSDTQSKFSPLVPHLVRALQVRGAMDAARQKQMALMEVIHRLPFGVVFLDSMQRVLEMSAAAQILVRQAQCVHYTAGRIRAMRPDDDRRLQRAIFQTVAMQAVGTAGDTVVMRGAGIGRTLTIAVIPVRSPHLFISSTPACMLVMVDPACSPTPPVTAVKQILGLTEAEALLACVLFKGVSLREAASHLGLSINTCKSQLKAIYAKTGCRSHVDLAKTLLLTGITERFQNDAVLRSFGHHP